MRTKRKDKNKKPRYQQLEEAEEEAANIGGLGKNLLLLAEGETEEAYFEKLKQNPWLNGSLAGVKIERNNDFKAACDKANELAKQGIQVWKVVDNDKQNAFVLEQNEIPFFTQRTVVQLPPEICDQLQAAYNLERHKYFLSVHDYLQWLNQAIGAENTVEYWDRIQYYTPIKNWEYEKYFKPSKDDNIKLRLAYSCISFEFWLILHFEQNVTPFLWVDKGKSKTDDIVTYLQTLRPTYEKGYFNKKTRKEKLCHAYNCLYPNFDKIVQTKDAEWQVLVRIFKAIQNADWLRGQMKPILERQCGKWYEVNPYIKGMDDLLKELLNIKPLGKPLEYFGLTLQFDFDIENAQLTFDVSINDGQSFIVGAAQASCFKIKNGAGQSFLPSIPKNKQFLNGGEPIHLKYDFSQSSDSQYILIFKDPRNDGKSSQWFFILTA